MNAYPGKYISCLIAAFTACLALPAHGEIKVNMDMGRVLGKRPPDHETCVGVVPIKEGTEEFERRLGERPGFLKGDECFQITPAFIKQQSDYRIFKFQQTKASYLLYKDKTYKLGECFGGSGLDDVMLADLNKDGKDELYFTYSWGSGIHRSQVGYFDPVKEELVFFDFSHKNSDLTFKKIQKGENELILYDYLNQKEVNVQTPVAKIILEKGKIELKETPVESPKGKAIKKGASPKRGSLKD